MRGNAPSRPRVPWPLLIDRNQAERSGDVVVRSAHPLVLDLLICTIACRDLVISFRGPPATLFPFDDDLVGSREPAPRNGKLRVSRDVGITASDGAAWTPSTAHKDLTCKTLWPQRATDRIDPSQSCAKDQICLEATDPMDNAMTAERRSRVDPKNRLKLAGAIDKDQCGIGSPTWARTRDLRINSPSIQRSQ